MSFELLTYGLVAGLLYGITRWQCVHTLYRFMLVAMLAGRVVWGIVQLLLFGISGDGFTWQMFMVGAFLNAIPGIYCTAYFNSSYYGHLEPYRSGSVQNAPAYCRNK